MENIFLQQKKPVPQHTLIVMPKVFRYNRENQNIRSMKHDMTNHIITLERLYARNKEEAKAYGTELREALSEAAGRINSGNPVTDEILQEKQKEAEQRQIDFKINFHYPTGSNVNAFGF